MTFNMNPNIFLLGIVFLFGSPGNAFAKKVNLVASSPDIAWLAKQIGGEHVEVTSLLTGREDPHYVDAVPDYIRLVSQADVVCIIGLGLEVGWIPKVLGKSGNAKVQPGGEGYCETGKRVNVIGKPTGKVDRSQGDVHPEGNPHFWLGPKAMLEAGTEVRDVLQKVDIANAEAYQKNYQSLEKMLAKIKADIFARLKPLQGKAPTVIEYHKEFGYFFKEFNIVSLGSIEEKPGVPPSAGRIASISLEAKSKQLKVALAKPSDPEGVLRKFSQISGVTVKKVSPSMILGEVVDYKSLLEKVSDTLLSETVAKKAP